MNRGMCAPQTSQLEPELLAARHATHDVLRDLSVAVVNYRPVAVPARQGRVPHMKPNPRLTDRAASTDVLDQQLAGPVPFGPGMATKEGDPVDGFLVREVSVAMLAGHGVVEPPAGLNALTYINSAPRHRLAARRSHPSSHPIPLDLHPCAFRSQ